MHSEFHRFSRVADSAAEKSQPIAALPAAFTDCPLDRDPRQIGDLLSLVLARYLMPPTKEVPREPPPVSAPVFVLHIEGASRSVA